MTLVDLMVVLVAACGWMALGWFVADGTGKAGYGDVFWSTGVGLAGVFLALAPLEPDEPVGVRQLLVATLVGLWSARLGTHVLLRTMRGGEDPRYVKLKRDWGREVRTRMFWFLQMHAITIALLALTIFVTARSPRPELDWRDWLGIAIVAAGVVGESISDQQLRSFAAVPGNRGRVCDVGLWSWSRHPNYFFEFLGWLAYPVIGLDPFGSYPWGWAALIGPVLMFWLLVFGSGIPPLERSLLESRGEAFRRYQRRVSAFVPLPPRKRDEEP